MYQALYRKWRPKTFSEVVGQAHITDTLQRQVAEGRVGHAYLFTGTRGTGKTTCARILAKAVNCEHPVDGAPCCQCNACRGIDSGTLLDVTELDAASNNGVDQVRALREEAVYTPSVLKKRVYIIDEVHMLSIAAFNALLKILEEPPEHLLFILATTELHKVPATILSRCQRFSFKRLLPRDIQQQLLHIAQAEQIDLSPDGAELLARMANGAMRDALSLLDQCRAVEGAIDNAAVLEVLGLAGATQTVQLMRCVLERRTGDALALFDQLYRGGKDVAALLSELSDLCRDMTILRAAPDGGSALLTGLYDRKTLAGLAGDLPMTRFLYLTETLQQCCAALPDSIRPRTDAELCLLKLCDETLSGDLTALCQRVTALEKGGVPAAPQSAAPKRASARPAAERPVPAARELPIETRYDEAPPPPEEYGERVFDIPDDVQSAPAPAPRPAQKTIPQTAETSTGDTAVWTRLIDHYKGRLSVRNRVFLDMAGGVVADGCLTVLCKDEFVKASLDNETVLSVLREVTSCELGTPIRVQLAVGKAPKATARPAARPAPIPTPAPEPKPEPQPEPEPPPAAAPEPAPVPEQEAPPAPPQETPPWEEPPAAAPTPGGDALDELTEKGQQLEHFKIT